MAQDQSKRKNILISPDYRTSIGKKLREKRIALNFSIGDVAYMLDIPERTVISMENGTVTNIDYYVEFAKAVAYPLESLSSFNIPLVPLKKLPLERKEKVKLTFAIRECIVNSGFLNERRSVEDIRNELLRLNQIPDDKKVFNNISGVMRNLVDDASVVIAEKTKGKNMYKARLKVTLTEVPALASEKTQTYAKTTKKAKTKK